VRKVKANTDSGYKFTVYPKMASGVKITFLNPHPEFGMVSGMPIYGIEEF